MTVTPGGYPGARYGDASDLFADIVLTRGATGTGSITLNMSPSITTPNFTTSFAVDGVTFGQHSTDYHEILERSGVVQAVQFGNTNDPTNYYNNTTHNFRTRALGSIGTWNVTGLNVTGRFVGTSASSLSFAVGRQGTTSPTLVLDSSTASCITGIKVTAAAAGGGVGVAAVGEATVTLKLDSAGTGTIDLNTTGAGNVRTLRNFDIAHNTSPTITFGTSGNTPATYKSQGTGDHNFVNGAGEIVFAAGPNTGGTQANRMRLASNISTLPPFFTAAGTDTNIGMNFTTKGTGSITFNGGTGGATAILSINDPTVTSGRTLNITGASATGTITISTSGGDLNVTPALRGAASVVAHNGTGVPAGGTAGAGFMFSSVTNFGIFFGSGAPTLAAATGSIYLRTDGSSSQTRAYSNTNGSTTWTPFVTVA